MAQIEEALQSHIKGEVAFAGGPGYDEARNAWNLAVDQRPAVVVVAESAADVARAVCVARDRGLRIAPQGTGHGSSALEPLDGSMLLKTSRLRRVTVDPLRRVARAEAGAEWQHVTAPAGAHGLAALAGTSPNVGVTGYTLGGGLSWLARRHGLAANSVTAIELVLPDGRSTRADAGEEPDLFWALRGGGGSFGVVTAIEMTLYPIREIYAGGLFFPIQRTDEVLQAWRAWTDAVPDELTSMGRILRVPPIPEIPAQLRGRHFVLVEAALMGDQDTGAELLRPLRQLGPVIDTFAMVPAPALQQVNMDPAQPVPSGGDGLLLADAPTGAIEALVAQVGPDADTPLVSIEIRHLGGALAREAPGAGALAKFDASYLVFAGGFAPTPDVGEAVLAHARNLEDALARWRAGYDYYNFVETRAGANAALPPATYRRLQGIKATYDPEQVIISAHPIQPHRR